MYLQVRTNLETKTNPDNDLRDSDPIAWISTHFYIPETSAPIVLEPYQIKVLREALAKDDDGLFRYSTVLWSDLKKSAKSTIAAAVALYMAWHNDHETVRIVANDLNQADSRTFHYIERAVMLNPLLKERCKIKNYTITLPNHTEIRAIPVDPKGEAGGGDVITCFTELWAYKNTASKQLWVETALSPLKYGKSIRWCESYAGYEGESPILEQLYRQGVKEGTRIDDDLELYRAEGRLLVFWNTRPRCYWQTPSYYAQEATSYTPEEFNRIHRNQWTSSQQQFIQMAWWDACQATIAPLERRQPMVLAIDAAVTSDCFALVGVTRNKDVIQERYFRLWTPPNIDFSEIEKEINRLVNTFNVECVTYDPYQMEYFAARLTESGYVYMRSFQQGAPRLVADKALYDRIREQRLKHSGNSTLREHVNNANAKLEGDKLRIVKRTEKGKIDGLVALSMACHVADELELG